MRWQRHTIIVQLELLLLRSDIHVPTVIVVIGRGAGEDGGMQLPCLLQAHGHEVYLQGLSILGMLVDDDTDVAAAAGVGGHYGIEDRRLAAGMAQAGIEEAG